MVDGGALVVHGTALRPGRDQPVEVPRLELVRLRGQRTQVGDAEVAGAGGEHTGTHAEGGQRRVAAGRAAADGHAGRVHPSRVGEEARAGDDVVQVQDPPAALQRVPVAAAVAGRAAVVDVGDAEAPGGPVLDLEVERGGRRGRRAAVHDHQQRRPFTLRRRRLGIRRRVDQRVRLGDAGTAVLGRKGDVLGGGEPGGVESEVPGGAQHLVVAAVPVHAQHHRLGRRPRGHADHAVVGGPDVPEHGVRQVQLTQPAVLAHGEPVGAGSGVGEHQPAVRQQRVPALPEDPLRAGDVAPGVDHDLDLAARPPAVEAPQVGAVRQEQQAPVGSPLRLHDRLAGAAGDDRLGAVGGPDDELGGVPRHVGVVPLQPGQRTVGPGSRVGHEVGPGDEHLGAAVRADPHDLVDDVGGAAALGVGLPDGEQPVAGDHQVGVPRPGADRRLGGDRDGCVTAGVEPVQPLVGEVREPQDAAGDRPRAAAVLVHAGTGVERRGEHVGGRPVGRAPDDHRAAALGGTALGPPDVLAAGRAVDDHLPEPCRRADDELGGDRGGPAAVGRFRWHVPTLEDPAALEPRVVSAQNSRSRAPVSVYVVVVDKLPALS